MTILLRTATHPQAYWSLDYGPYVAGCADPDAQIRRSCFGWVATSAFHMEVRSLTSGGFGVRQGSNGVLTNQFRPETLSTGNGKGLFREEFMRRKGKSGTIIRHRGWWVLRYRERAIIDGERRIVQRQKSLRRSAIRSANGPPRAGGGDARLSTNKLASQPQLTRGCGASSYPQRRHTSPATSTLRAL